MDFFGDSYTNIAIIVVILIVAYFVYTYFTKSTTEPIQEEYFDNMQQDGENFETNEEFDTQEEGFEEPTDE